MSERNIEFVRRVAEAFNARDVEAFIAGCDARSIYAAWDRGDLSSAELGAC